MYAHAAPLIPAKDPMAPPCGGAVAWARALMRKQAYIVRRLADKALDVARGLSRQMSAERAALPRLSVLFDKASRAVMIAVLLASRLSAELSKTASELATHLERARREAEAPEAGPCAPQLPRTARAHAPDDGDREETEGRLSGDAERLADLRALARLERYVRSRPIDEVIARVCRDLGLSAEWLREVAGEWTDRLVAVSKAASPLKALQARQRLSGASSARALLFSPEPVAPRLPPGLAQALRPP